MRRWDTKAKNLLKNLQSYKILTGEVDPNQLYGETHGEQPLEQLDQGEIIGTVLHDNARKKVANRFYQKQDRGNPLVQDEHTGVTYYLKDPKPISKGYPGHVEYSSNALDEPLPLPKKTTSSTLGNTQKDMSFFPGYQVYESTSNGKSDDEHEQLSATHTRKKAKTDFFGLLSDKSDDEPTSLSEEEKETDHEHSVNPYDGINSIAALYSDDSDEDDFTQKARYRQEEIVEDAVANEIPSNSRVSAHSKPQRDVWDARAVKYKDPENQLGGSVWYVSKDRLSFERGATDAFY
ncbi:hypothetical protein K7432_017502 [Basidiobolus ranarum]|uniref:Uncharacterized protein n=1 Tax=Basidiobolus ranarum TaxID=34480 RepID=A0ABR2WDB6_9FUNG